MSIPASQLVQVNPSVLPAGGNALNLSGLMLTTSAQPPIGSVLSFPTAAAVGAYFGLSSTEYLESVVYFNGNDNSLSKPGALLVAQYNTSRVSAYVRGGNASGLLATLKTITSGTFEVLVDGFSWKNNAIDFSGASTLSAVASTLQSDLTLPGSASVTGSISPNTGVSGGGILTITVVGSGTVAAGQTIAGSGVSAGTYITGYGTGTGGTGTYYVNISQTVVSEALTMSASAASFTAAIAGTTLTVSAVGSGVLQPGMLVTGTGVSAKTAIKSQLTGTIGGTGTYQISPSQTVGSEAMTGAPATITVTYDSLSGGFVITSGLTGIASTIAYPTRTLATTMLLTAATGAILSQGAGIADPTSFMTALIATTHNWASFFLVFDPDSGNLPCTQKELFSTWTDSTNDRYIYCAEDYDPAPTTSLPASSSFGAYLQTNNLSGTILTWNPNYPAAPYYGAFVSGMIASIDFNQTNGRTTLAFKGQTGLLATVTDPTSADNLAGDPQTSGSFGNGYNFYGAYATSNQNFIQFQRGTISGPFEWADTYINEIWLTNALQLSLMELLANTRSIPYNNVGYGLVRAACLDPINAAVNFGAIVPGVTLSALQIAEINTAAGNTQAANTVITSGWYLQIVPAVAQTRQARTSPPINLWYADGGSIQAIKLASITVQ